MSPDTVAPVGTDPCRACRDRRQDVESIGAVSRRPRASSPAGADRGPDRRSSRTPGDPEANATFAASVKRRLPRSPLHDRPTARVRAKTDLPDRREHGRAGRALARPERDRGRARRGGALSRRPIAVLGLGAMDRRSRSGAGRRPRDSPSGTARRAGRGARRRRRASGGSAADAVRNAEVVITMVPTRRRWSRSCSASTARHRDPRERDAHRHVDGRSDRDRLRRRSACAGASRRPGARERPVCRERQARDPRGGDREVFDRHTDLRRSGDADLPGAPARAHR